MGPPAAGLRPTIAGIIATSAAVGVTIFAVATHTPAAPKMATRGAPPWSRPADTAVGVRLAGLEMSRATGEVTRYDLHLDVFVNGKHVAVPANIGVDQRTSEISALHTTDSSGIVQVDSNAQSPRYTLGQLFDEWQVPLSATRIGGLQAGRRESLAAYVDGTQAKGNPRRIALGPQQQIAIEFGAGPFHPPASYQFPPAA